jgi:hypothetical protein
MAVIVGACSTGALVISSDRRGNAYEWQIREPRRIANGSP